MEKHAKEGGEGGETPIFDAERRRFLQTALGGLAGLGLAGSAAGAALAFPVPASPLAFQGGCTTTTVVTSGPKTVTIRSSSGTFSRTCPPGDGEGMTTLSTTGTLKQPGAENPWSATYSYTTTGNYTSAGGTLTGTSSKPEMTSVVTWSKTSTTPCTATDPATETLPTNATTTEESICRRVWAGDPAQVDDLDAAHGFGTEVRLA
jgi:hypothetical protein